MKHKIISAFLTASFAVTGLATLTVVGLASCSSDDESFVLRSDSRLVFTSAGGEKAFTVCTDGAWSVTTNAPWIAFDKSGGTGDGVTRDKITVSALRNIGDLRTDSFILHAVGQDLPVVCTQEEGAPLHLGTAKLTGALQVNVPAEGVGIEVPYTYGYAGGKVRVSAALSGTGAEGLSVEARDFVMDGEKGTFTLPLSGTPTQAGPLSITVTTDDATANTSAMQATVLAQVVLEEHFDLMLWGGDVVAGKKGIKGGFKKTGDGTVIDESVAVTACSATTDGSNDLVLTHAESYRQLRGFSGWSGVKVYEHPGYVKAGTASIAGSVITPALARLSAGASRVTVTCRVAQYVKESGGAVAISVTGGGTPSITRYTFENAGKTSSSTWESVSFTIDNPTRDTKIVFAAEGNKRFCIDDVVVSE